MRIIPFLEFTEKSLHYPTMKKTLITIFLSLIHINLYAATLEVGAGKTYSTIQSAVNAAQPGDTVLIYSGVYKEKVTTSKSGSAGNYIIIKSAELGVIIDAEGIRDGILLKKHNYIIIDGFNIIHAYRGSDYADYGGAINCQRSHYAIIRNNVITDGTGGTGGGPNPKAGVGDINIQNCDSLLLENNRALSRKADFNLGAWYSKNMIIRGNEFSGGLRYPVKISASSHNVLFEKNYVHTDRVGTNNGVHMNFFLRDSQNAIVRYNVFNAQGSDALGAANFYDYMCDQTENHNIYNNIFLHDHKNQGAVQWTCQEGTYFRNNIIVSLSAAHKFNFNPGKVVIDYNIHYAPVEYENNVFSNFTDGANNITADPHFLATGAIPSPYYRLKSTSPAIDAGDPNTTTGTDFIGTKVPQGAGFDIGAFEYTP